MTKFKPGGPPRYRHQQQGLRDIIKNKGVHALLFEPGTGKTGTALDYASLLALNLNREIRVLIIAPLAALDTWTIQAETFVADGIDVWAEAVGGSIRQRAEILATRAGNPFPNSSIKPKKREHVRAAGHHKSSSLRIRCDDLYDEARLQGPGSFKRSSKLILMAVTIDSFSSRAALTPSMTVNDLLIEGVKRYAPDLIIIDESHRIKSASSNMSRSISRLNSVCPRRLILTGTIMPHSPMDVFGQWRFLNPDAFGTRMADGSVKPLTFSNFRDRYAQLGGWQGKQVVGFKRLDELQHIMAQNSTVARKSEALDLPATTDVIIPVQLSPAEKRAYSEMKKQLATLLPDGSMVAAGNKLAQMMKLRQVTSGFMNDDTGALVPIGTSKLATIKSIIQDNLADENRIVVFSYFRNEVQRLKEMLKDDDGEVLIITGDTNVEDRSKMRERFGSNEKTRLILIAQIKTMSLAVNELVTASHAIFGSLSQQRDDFVQARDRLHRLGQTKPVTFWYAMVSNSIDEVIFNSHQNRTNLEAAILAHISAPDL